MFASDKFQVSFLCFYMHGISTFCNQPYGFQQECTVEYYTFIFANHE